MAKKDNLMCVVHRVILHSLGLQFHAALLGIHLMKYGPTHHTIISVSLKTICNYT